jgi:hypothetical protein
MTSIETVERLRPAAMQSRPVRLEGIFDEPESILRLVEQRAPYVTMAAYHRMQDTLGGARTQPFFRDAFEDEFLLQNPRWLRAAREAFQAEIVRPFKCILNLNGPMAATGVHVDLPIFRGFAAPTVPVWLLMNMSYSGLFQDWMVPIASGLAWFYRGEGGAFAYWPDGPEGPPAVERSPLWNSGVMSDNEFMFHGVSPIGSDAERARLAGRLRAGDLLHYAGQGDWEIRDGERTAFRLPAAQVRISLLWKAYVFRDQRHLASFEDRAMDLTTEQVVQIYRQDLARRDIALPPPADLFTDAGWRSALESAYRPGLSPHAADDL